MNLLDSISGEQVAGAVVTIVLQVTFVLGVTCGVAWLFRRNAAARHAVCLAGLVLAVACPLVAVNAGPLRWTWLRIDWPVEETGESDVEPKPMVIDEPRLPAEFETAVAAWTPPETELEMQDPERPVTVTITVPPDVLYRPGETDPVDDSNQVAPVENLTLTTPRGPDSVASVPASASIDAVVAAPVEDMRIDYATIVRIAVGSGLLIWLLGAIVQIGRWRIGCGRLKGMLRGVVELDRTRFGALIAEAAAVVGMRRPPKNLSGPLVPIPMVYGVWRARILLPQPFVEWAGPSELRDVLIHEYAHVRRRDPWISLLQRIVAVLYWPHPLVHVLNRQLAGAREELCDNYVLREERGTEFAEMLLSLSEQLQGLGAPVGLLGLVSRRGRLEARVSGILDQRRRTGTRMGRGSAPLLVAAGVGLLFATAGIRAGNEFSEGEAAAIIAASGDALESSEVEETGASSDQDSPAGDPEFPGAVEDRRTEQGEDVDQDAARPTEDNSTIPDPQSVIDRLSERCDPWINTPTEQLRSLQYTYTLGNDERQVQLVSGVSNAPRSMWYGSTLGTGLHWLLHDPERFDVTVERQESDANRLEMTIRSKPDQQGIHLEIGNGISGSWRGYFSHGSDEMTLVVDADHLLPLRETHKFGGDPNITEIHYLDWQRVSDAGWIPRRVDVTHGEAVYRMHFTWRKDAAWLLTHAETEYEGNTHEVARVSDVVVNDEELIQRSREEQRRQEAAAGVLHTLLDHNRPWLMGDLSGLESLSYTFHTLREDVQEECVGGDDGTVVMQVTHDGQGKMGDRLGERQTGLPSGEWARANRDDRFALIHEASEERDRQPYAERLQQYGRIGCQFDLPLFRYEDLIDGATVEIEDGEWKGTPCHVATVRSLGRDVYLGCGTMLGFTSWSYVHHFRPAYETIYIDREHNIPLHETLVSSRDNKRFEIDFSDYREIESGQWAPLLIRIESPDYFTCELKFQLIEGRHWLLSEVESWFDPEEKSRGVVEDVRVNQSSELRDAALEQIEAARAVFGDAGEAVSQTAEVPTHPFVLGRQVRVGSLEVLFTLNPAGELILRCAPAEGQTLEAGRSVSVLLLDQEDRILSAAQELFVELDGRFEALAGFGHSTGLGTVVRYSLFSDGNYVESPSSIVRRIRVRPIDGKSGQSPPVGDESGQTRVIGVAVRPGEEGQMVAAVHFASQDRMNEFGLDVSVGVFNKQGELIAAGAKQGRLLVKSEIVEETWEVPLGELAETEDVDRVAMGVTRGQTYSAPMGSMWGRFLITDPIFSFEDLLAGETDGTWWGAISQLARSLEDDSMREEFLHDPDRERALGENRARREELLRPYAARLVEIATHADDPRLAAAATRMAGLAGDRSHADALLPLLISNETIVRDAAALALGLLGRADGLDRLREMLAMSPEELRDSHAIDLELNSLVIPLRRWDNEWDDDILTALLMIGSDDAVRVAGEQAMTDLQALEVGTGNIQVPFVGTGGDEVEIVSGNPQRVARLWRLLGELKQAGAVDYLTRSLSWLSEHPAVADVMNLQPLIIALVDYEEQTQDLLAERIRRGDYATIRVLKESRNPFYIPAAREMMLSEETEAWTIYQGVTYLWNVGTDEAIQVMVELYEQGLPTDRRTRMRLCEALAYHGDDRGLPEAFEVLVAACAPEEPPEDGDARRKWEREREDAREDPLDVFERAKSASRIAVVEQHLETADVATQIACLTVLGTLRVAMPESVQETLKSWKDSQNEEVATEATLLLGRE